MNILFCTTSCVSEQKGGTERITARISMGLYHAGHKCYSAYKNDISSAFLKTKFEGAYNVNVYPLNNIVYDKNIDVVIFQKMTRDIVALRNFIQQKQISCKIISVLHFNPGYEEKALCFSNFVSGISLSNQKIEVAKNILRVLTYPIYKTLYPLRNKQLYKIVYHYSDQVVLLSKAFVREYQNYARIKDDSKFIVIPNALSYDEFLPMCGYDLKKKQVLIVARLSEVQKKISLALRIWKQIEQTSLFDGWSLNIVGHGESLSLYQKMVSDLKLKRITFCGLQNPKNFYQESRIFMMTSSYEGWGLTLTEAQQFGCIPFAFNSFSSLCDIIEDEQNGFVIKNADINEYVNKMKQLMLDCDRQREIAKNAILSSKRFRLSTIISQWENLLKK